MAITEDVAIAVQNMSSLLAHPTQRALRSDCLSVMHSAPLFFSSLDSDPASQPSVPPSMPQSLNALASLYPSDAIESLLATAVAATSLHVAQCTTSSPAQRWEAGMLVTAKCPVTKKFRAAKVVLVNERGVLVEFGMPDHTTVRVSYPGKFLRAVGAHKAAPRASDAGSASQQPAVSASPPPPVSLSEDTLSLCALTLLPFTFQERHYQPLFSMLLRTCSHASAEYRALLAINSLVSNSNFGGGHNNFVAHMSAADPNWIAKLAPIANTLNRADGSADRSQDALKSTIVSIFDALLRAAASADQRRTFIEVLDRARIVHALFQFCQHRESQQAAADTAACVLLSCAAISPSHVAISWLRSSFREPRRSGGSSLLQSISTTWISARENSDDDFDDNRCVLSVERYNLIASSVKSFGFCTLQGLAKRLKVNFVLERGCDAGGLTVEWLHLLLDTVFSDFAFFLPVLLPSGQPSGVVRVNHSAAHATALPAVEVFRMVGCCLALCLQVLCFIVLLPTLRLVTLSNS